VAPMDEKQRSTSWLATQLRDISFLKPRLFSRQLPRPRQAAPRRVTPRIFEKHPPERVGGVARQTPVEQTPTRSEQALNRVPFPAGHD
jgi:hypothetical protein